MQEEGFTVFERLFTIEEMADLARIVEELEDKRNKQLKAEGDSGISRAGEITFNSHLAESDPLVRAFCRASEPINQIYKDGFRWQMRENKVGLLKFDNLEQNCVNPAHNHLPGTRCRALTSTSL